jgi:PTH2 family peptidyl-tRNA hydrolase
MQVDVKQVIIIRKDLSMRRGKEIAQGSHASMRWLLDRLIGHPDNAGNDKYIMDTEESDFTDEEFWWMTNGTKKVVLQVDTEQELIDLHKLAIIASLSAYIVTDSGFTEFHGVPTKTALAIGPNKSEDIDKITSNLRLY